MDTVLKSLNGLTIAIQASMYGSSIVTVNLLSLSNNVEGRDLYFLKMPLMCSY